jgi:hypothetical protein
MLNFFSSFRLPISTIASVFCCARDIIDQAERPKRQGQGLSQNTEHVCLLAYPTQERGKRG